jgi:hypothetical protein
LTALDELRSNRYSDYTAGTESGSDLLAAIQLERRLELFAEGHRFFDLKRWNLGISRSATDGEFIDGQELRYLRLFKFICRKSFI